MNTNLHFAIVGDRIVLERPSGKFSRHFTPNVVTEALDKGLTAPGQACLVEVRLQIAGNRGGNSCRLPDRARG